MISNTLRLKFRQFITQGRQRHCGREKLHRIFAISTASDSAISQFFVLQSHSQSGRLFHVFRRLETIRELTILVSVKIRFQSIDCLYS